MTVQHIVLFSFPRPLSEGEAADMRAMVASWPAQIGLMGKCRFGTDLTGARTRGYRDDFFLKVMAAAQAGDPARLAAVLRHQRVYLLTELRSLADARAAASGSPVVGLLVKAAELHVRADLGVVDAAEHDLTPETLAALRVHSAPAEAPRTRANPAHDRRGETG